MKRIINGKKYDTDTAIEVLPSARNALFQKTNGEFFVLSQSSVSLTEIHPLTLDEAKKYVENHANDKYESIFGECQE